MIAARIGIHLVQAYQCLISPLFPRCCRFFPSCSQYAIESLQKYGLIKGAWMSLRRLAKCHPFHPGGYDPV